MSSVPEISIIVPVYKTEKKIARCIESILGQTLKDFELILIDDGSPDECGKICDDYAKTDRRIRVIHQSNQGAAAARNNGIKVACGEYIGFVDSDDYINRHFLSTLYSKITKTNADLAMCNLSLIQGKAFKVQDHLFANDELLDRAGITIRLYGNIFFNKNTSGYFSLCNKLFKKSIIMKCNIFIDENMSFGEDMIFVIKYLSQCKNIVFSNQSLYYYEQTSTGLFTKYRRSFIDDISACYIQIIKQTAPQEYNRDDLLPLNLKYFNYINRQFADISKYEKHKFLQIRRVLSNKTVRKIFRELADMSTEQAINAGIEQNELKSARLVKKGFLLAAAFVADYQFNPHFWLRRLKKC